jgi:uncharacterized protein (DUF849 family)
MLLQVALNGGLTKDDHPAVPVSPEELADDTVARVQAGARAFHLHPRDAQGRERLDPEVVDEVVIKVREACGVPVGVTTGAWIEPDLPRRLELVRAWQAPDYATVNLSEPGATEIMKALIGAEIGIEAGVRTVADAELLARSGLAGSLLRICVEPTAISPAEAVAFVEEIHAVLDGSGLTAPRLQHGDGEAAWAVLGDGEAAWAVLADAVRRGLGTRIGLEDTLHEPGGELTTGNEGLVRTARELCAGPRL